MKKLLLIFAITFLTLSCSKKDEPTPTPTPIQTIVNDEVGLWTCTGSYQYAYNSSNQLLYMNTNWLKSMELRSDYVCITINKNNVSTTDSWWLFSDKKSITIGSRTYNVTFLTANYLHFDITYYNSKGERIEETYTFSK